MNKESDRIRRLIEWVKQYENSHLSSNISIQTIPNFGLGGIAARIINNCEEDLIRIDLRLSLNYMSAFQQKSNGFGQVFLNCIEKILSDDSMNRENYVKDLLSPSTGYEGSVHHHNNDMFDRNAILFYCFLIHEKFVSREESFWFPYLDLLPSVFDTPLFYTEEELDELHGSNLLKSVLSIKHRLSQIYEFVVVPIAKMRPQQFPLDIFTLDNLIWAYSVIWSRVFPIEAINHNDQKAVLPTLLPLIDILNHRTGENITYFTNTNDNTFTLKSKANLISGQQVFNNYGAKSNDSFLLSYGFVVENNEQDTLFVQLGVDVGNEQQMDQKKQLLQQNQLKLGYYLKKNFIPDDLFKTLRICFMDEEEIYYFHNNQLNDIISFRNEIQVLAIKQQFRQKLFAFKTSIDYDRELLNKLKNKISPTVQEYRMMNILIYRIGQKEILQSAMQRLNEMQIELITRKHGDLPQEIQFKMTPFSNLQQFAQKTAEWIKSNSLSKVNFHIEATNTSLNMKTINRVESSEDLLVFHMKDVITYDIVMSSPIGILLSSLLQVESNMNDIFDEETMFMLYLLYSKFAPDTENRFNTFFSSIPDHFNCTLFFSEKALYELQNQSLIEETLDLKNGLKETFDQILEFLHSVRNVCPNQQQFDSITSLSKKGVLTFEHFLWAYVLYDTTISRIESDNIEYNEYVYILPVSTFHTPYIQYNASKRLDTFFNEQDQSIHVVAVTPFEPNTIIASNSLAEKPHDELLLRYGACLKPEEFSRYYAKNTYALELDESLASFINTSEVKIQIMQTLPWLTFEHILRIQGKPLPLINFFKLCFMSEEEAHHNLEKLANVEQKQLTAIELETLRSEEVSLTITNLTQNILQSYETSIVEDMEMLKYNLIENVHQYNSICYRLHVKAILQDNINTIN